MREGEGEVYSLVVGGKREKGEYKKWPKAEWAQKCMLELGEYVSKRMGHRWRTTGLSRTASSGL